MLLLEEFVPTECFFFFFCCFFFLCTSDITSHVSTKNVDDVVLMSIVNFEHISHVALVFALFTFNNQKTICSEITENSHKKTLA